MKVQRDVINELHEKFGHLTRKEIGNIIQEYFSIQTSELLETGSARLPILGKLEITETKPRKARNLSTGETINVPASKRIKFKPKKEIKLQVKNLK